MTHVLWSRFLVICVWIYFLDLFVHCSFIILGILGIHDEHRYEKHRPVSSTPDGQPLRRRAVQRVRSVSGKKRSQPKKNGHQRTRPSEAHGWRGGEWRCLTLLGVVCLYLFLLDVILAHFDFLF